VRVLPNQVPGLREALRLSKADVDRAAWAITAAGERFAGASAVNRVLAELPGWRWLARLYAVPPLRWLEDIVYQWIAAHRGLFRRWGATPECRQLGVNCTAEGE
jgi:predicted DCC family thiol-disulfide oxidoreductase YuxK